MGIQLAKFAAIQFRHLSQNQTKVLNWMCLRTLDEPDLQKGIGRAFFYAKWYELAIAMNREIPEDPKKREHLRKEVNKICAELVEEGALRPRRNPYRPREKAYDVILDRNAAVPLDQRRRPSKKRKPVDNSHHMPPVAVQEELWTGVDSPPVSEGDSPPVSEGDSPPVSEGDSPPVSEGESPPVLNKDEKQVQEQGEEQADDKLNDAITHQGDQLSSRARAVDNPAAATGWLSPLSRARAAFAATPRHARPTPPPIDRPHRE